MEWNCEDIFKVINLYQQFPCLWDIRSSLYKRVDLKRNAWAEIAKNMCKEEDEVKKKIKNLRSAYVAEKRKIECSKKSGTSTEEIYVPHLFYFEELNFLNSSVMFRKTTSNLIKEQLETSTMQFGSEDFASLQENLNESQESFVTDKAIHSPETPRDNNKTSKKRRVEREEKLSSAIDAFVRQADMSCAMMTSSSKKDEETMYTPFGRSISLQLAQLSLPFAAEAMAEIQAIITKKILKESKTDILQIAINEAEFDHN